MTPGATVSPAAGAAAASSAENALAALIAESWGRGPVVLAGSKRAEFSASGNSGATSPAATSSGLQAGFSAGPVKRESSSSTFTGTETPSSFSARTVAFARLASPAWPSTASGADSPAPRSTSPPPVSTTDPGVSPATAVVLKRRSGPSVRRAATAVRSFMLEAGTRTASPDRSKRTSPVAASCTTPVKLPAPSTFRVWLSCAAREPGSGTGAVAVSGSILSGSPLWAPPADSVPGTWCQGGADGPAVAGSWGAEEARCDGQARGERERHDQQRLEQQRKAPPQRPGHRVRARGARSAFHAAAGPLVLKCPH